MPNNIRTSTALALLLAAVATICPAHGQTPNVANKAERTVEMEGVPLDDAIRNLARQLSLNYILDPRLLGTSGSLASNPFVTGRWHLTALQVLEKVLRDNGLTMVTNSATTIARIIRTNDFVYPVSEKLVGNGSDPVIPLMRIDDDLDKAITDIASKAHLNISLDPNLHVPSAQPDTAVSDSRIYVRWENVTARQALTAILDAYNLAVAESSGASPNKLIVRPAPVATTTKKDAPNPK